MRLSSIVSLVVVTASFALGGCAADAEQTSGTDQPNVALSDPNANANEGRLNDVAQTGKLTDNFANPSDNAKAHGVLHAVGGEVDPRLDITPSGFDPVPQEKIGIPNPLFHVVNPLTIGMKTEPGYTPYSHRKPD